MPRVLTCLQAAMRFEEGDGAGRSSRPQHSSSPRGQRLPVQRGPLEGPLPDASSLSQGEIKTFMGAQAEPAARTRPTQPWSFPYQVSSGPRSPGDRARPPAPALWGDGPAPAALTGVPTAPRRPPRALHSQFCGGEEEEECREPASAQLRPRGLPGSHLHRESGLGFPRGEAHAAQGAPGGPGERRGAGTSGRERDGRSAAARCCREPLGRTGSAAAAYPASVGASSHGVGELLRSGQSQDFLPRQQANHHPCLRLSNSLAGTNESEVSPAAAGGGGAAEPVRRARPGVTPG